MLVLLTSISPASLATSRQQATKHSATKNISFADSVSILIVSTLSK